MMLSATNFRVGNTVRQALLKSCQIQTVRFQSSKTAINEIMKANVATKVLKQEKSSSDYNALSNHNLAKENKKNTHTSKTHPMVKVASQKKVKADYSHVPRVSSTGHVSPKKLLIDGLLSGHRPLNLAKTPTLHQKLGITDITFKVPSIWSSSPTGLEVHSEWDKVPKDIVKDLKPFTPPLSDEKKLEIAIKKQLLAPLNAKKGTSRGRVRPSRYYRLKKNKKII